MKYNKLTASLFFTGMLLLSGCKSTDDTTTTTTGAISPMATSSAAIMYRDGEIMGVTQREAPVNGGFQIYHIGTGEVVGFIQADGSVNNMGGQELGVCAGAAVSDDGVAGDCHVPTEDPAIAIAATAAVTATTGAVCSFTQSSADTSGNCPDTRNGDFNPSYSPSVCNANGYFWCSLSQSCLDKPVNVPECGEMYTR